MKSKKSDVIIPELTIWDLEHSDNTCKAELLEAGLGLEKEHHTADYLAVLVEENRPFWEILEVARVVLRGKGVVHRPRRGWWPVFLSYIDLGRPRDPTLACFTSVHESEFFLGTLAMIEKRWRDICVL